MRKVRSIWRPILDRIVPYEAGKPLEALEQELGIDALVRLSANESPLGPSPHVVAAICREAPRVHLYPDGGSTVLRQALAKRLGVSAEQILAANGADELLALLAMAAFDAGDDVVIPRPSFEPYTTMAYLAGITRRINIGSCIIVVPYRNPVVQARMIATLDTLSDGRLILGVGAGHVRVESEALGVP